MVVQRISRLVVGERRRDGRADLDAVYFKRGAEIAGTMNRAENVQSPSSAVEMGSTVALALSMDR
jgi:hypothetical protein